VNIVETALLDITAMLKQLNMASSALFGFNLWMIETQISIHFIRGHSEASQNTLNVSGEDVLSKSDE